MRLADLVTTSRRVAETRSRSEKTGVLADLLRRLAPEEIDVAVAWLSGNLRQGRIGLGGAAVRDARPGTAANEPTLTLGEVDATFERIASTTGAGSTAARVGVLRELLTRATKEGQDFLVRLIYGELRQGALVGLMADALAAASGLPAADVRRALMLAGELTAVARAALVEGQAGLDRFRLELLRPLQPMLASPAGDVSEALERLGEAAFELKLDGARVQVHKAGDEVRVFSRRGNDVTPAVPELVESVQALPARQLILDGEVIALRPDGAPLPFQLTMRRFGRKLDIARLRGELPLTPFFFDILHLDGEDLLDRPAGERFAALGAAVPGLTVPRIVTADAEEADSFFADALQRGHEGMMAKALDAPYEAGRRGFSWLKIKPAHTLDLVILAAEWGHGRRQGWLSNLHLGARDPENGGFVMLGKTFKGMTDEMLAWQTKKLQETALGTDGWTVHVRPELVVEVAFSDVQESPQYPAGMALRFARVKRYREDKTVAEADTIGTVRKIFETGQGSPGPEI
ncbi:MAG TPA: ATP-dependent DNA ligase [Thermoanaerobaculia bacterium]|jgi:DNA ligase-1|nr:ATP-dependent DNA ligase [Thermoanaerobaculia bacterium]